MSESPIRNRLLLLETHEEEADGELWLVSYADMVTLLFGFFVILYSFSTIDDKKFDQFSENFANAFNSKTKSKKEDISISGEDRQLRALQMLVSMLNIGENIEDAVDTIEKSFQEKKEISAAEDIAKKRIESKVDAMLVQTNLKEVKEEAIIDIVIPGEKLFLTGRHTLSKDALLQIRKLAREISLMQGIREIEISGHTDGRKPTQGALYGDNFTLSSLRAGAVASALIRFGINPNKIIVRGMGSLKPLFPEVDSNGNFNQRNMAKNRRIGIALKLGSANVKESH